jgi:polyisoprenoid-binding protein YceI
MTKFLPVLAMLVPLAAAHGADVYNIEPNHTSATFQFKHQGFSTFTGKFAKVSGTVTVDQAAKTGSADITIDATSITTGVPKFDEHLQSKDFFEVATYPTITFKSQKFQFKGDQLASLSGDLTIHGVTKPVTLTVTSFVCKEHPMAKMPACGADAKTTIKRSEFGMGNFVPMVGDEIPLQIEIEAIKK